jgi:hypothetical protein
MRGSLFASLASVVALLCGACATPPSPPNYEPYPEPTPQYLQMLKEQSDKEIEHLLDHPQICPNCRPLTEPIFIYWERHGGFFIKLEGEGEIAPLWFENDKVYQEVAAAQQRLMWEGVNYICECEGTTLSKNGVSYAKITSAKIVPLPRK